MVIRSRVLGMAAVCVVGFLARGAAASGDQPGMVCVSGTATGTDNGRNVQLFDAVVGASESPLVCVVCSCYAVAGCSSNACSSSTGPSQVSSVDTFVLWGTTSCGGKIGTVSFMYCGEVSTGTAMYLPRVD